MLETDKFENIKQYKETLQSSGKEYTVYNIQKVCEDFGVDIHTLPYSIRVLVESIVRQYDGENITEDHIRNIVNWSKTQTKEEYPFKPMRVILQDLTGVPSIVDIASMRQAMSDLGGNPDEINPENPVDLIIDHSVHMDFSGDEDAFEKNMMKEFERNEERYGFVKWATGAFDNFRAVPPATGIVHQVNIEYLSDVISSRMIDGELVAFPDSLVGTDSHTTMVNGLGVLGWGVGGIEAEAGMLGEASYTPIPEVIGVKMTGKLNKTVNATDLALRVTELLRESSVVGKFVEYYGPGYESLSLADRATISNMAPEYGATCGFFPIDQETLDYLELTNRSSETVDLVKTYSENNVLFYDPSKEPDYTSVIELDLSTVQPSISGPKRPQDRVYLNDAGKEFKQALVNPLGNHGFGLDESEVDTKATIELDGEEVVLEHGSVLIASITSCTNTSNPFVMLAAGLLAKKAVEKGLVSQPFVKTSLAPGSKAVTKYLEKAGLMPYLEKLGFHLAGYGCATCIGNSGPLEPAIQDAVDEHKLVASAVVSANRNFEGRVHAAVQANYLASPPLVVAYALAGNADMNWETEAIGEDQNGQPIYLKDIWPSDEEVNQCVEENVTSELYRESYENVFDDNPIWQQIPVNEEELYSWDDQSTYVANPPFFENMSIEEPGITRISGARVLAKVGDSITTDHISPAGAIPRTSPAGQYLLDNGVTYDLFNSYGSRRGHHEVMMRGTFANIRIRNHIADGKVGGYTKYWPTGEIMYIYDAAMKYKEDDTNLVILAGNDYGMGSSRDWAAKGVALLNVKAVIAESFERIHRSNLVMMGVLPLEYINGENAETLGLDGTESFDIEMDETVGIHDTVKVVATKEDGSVVEFEALVRFDSAADIKFYKNNGILPYVIRKKINSGKE